jgi:hypothetical protein
MCYHSQYYDCPYIKDRVRRNDINALVYRSLVFDVEVGVAGAADDLPAEEPDQRRHEEVPARSEHRRDARARRGLSSVTSVSGGPVPRVTRSSGGRGCVLRHFPATRALFFVRDYL